MHSEGEEVEDLEHEDVCLNEGEKNLQEVYDVVLEDCGRYAKVAKNAVKKTKKIEEEHKSTLVQLKDTKCEAEGLKEELLNAYSKIKFLNLKSFKQMSKWSAFPPRSLTVCFLLKNFQLTRSV